MPPDHAPGPDGFNGLLRKKCWDIISADFYRLCADFGNGLVDLRSINSSFITLIPKKDNPCSVNDYRPISLLNYSLKLLTKLLANILQSVILSGVHANQYGFLLKGERFKIAWHGLSSFCMCVINQRKKLFFLSWTLRRLSIKLSIRSSWMFSSTRASLTNGLDGLNQFLAVALHRFC